MRKYLPILLGLLVAVPAFSASLWPLDKIADPSASHTITLDDGEQLTLTKTDSGSAGSVLALIQNRTAGTANFDGLFVGVDNESLDGYGTDMDAFQILIYPSANDVDWFTGIHLTTNEATAALRTGILIDSKFGGEITLGIDLTDTDIVDAINIGDNIFATTTTDIAAADFDAVFGGVASDADAQHTHSLLAPLAGDNTWTGSNIFDGAVANGTEGEFANGDTTPDVSGARHFKTDTVNTTITNFDAGAGSVEDGQRITVRTNASELIYDCSDGLPLDCGGVDSLVTYSGDVTEWYYVAAGFGKWVLAGYVRGGLQGPQRPLLQATYLNGIDGSAVLVQPSTDMGVIWVDTGEDPSRLYFMGDDGIEHRLAYFGFFRECQRTITTEEVGDVLMCGKADGTITLQSLECVALGSVIPDSQTVEVVACTSDGASCATISTGITITATALETNYQDGGGTAFTISPDAWWGIKFISIGGGTQLHADYLHCQVGFTES